MALDCYNNNNWTHLLFGHSKFRNVCALDKFLHLFQFKRILHEVHPVGYKHLWIILSLEAPNLDQLGFKCKSCGGLIDLEVGGTIIVRNVRNDSPNNTVLHSRKLEPSSLSV